MCSAAFYCSFANLYHASLPSHKPAVQLDLVCGYLEDQDVEVSYREPTQIPTDPKKSRQERKGEDPSNRPMHGDRHGVTKRCRLCWLTNRALAYEPKCGGGELWGLSQ
jgi:hypothetical protein